jgi:hypothetical protein
MIKNKEVKTNYVFISTVYKKMFYHKKNQSLISNDLNYS